MGRIMENVPQDYAKKKKCSQATRWWSNKAAVSLKIKIKIIQLCTHKSMVLHYREKIRIKILSNFCGSVTVPQYMRACSLKSACRLKDSS